MARRVSFKKGTHAYAKRKEIAEGIARSHPGMSMARKFRMATSMVKKMRRTRHSGD